MSPLPVLTLHDLDATALGRLLNRFRITLEQLTDDVPIPGSFWGEPEAGVVGTTVYARDDTPLHSILHESCHVICMDGQRRANLDGDAGGDDLEEAAVCYLQILLAKELVSVGSERLMTDMDSWGYSFRLGKTARWFHEDADDALNWLRGNGVLDAQDELRYRYRSSPKNP